MPEWVAWFPFLLLMIISAFLVGIEPSAYLGIGVIGLCLVRSPNPLLKFVGSSIVSIGMIMFIVSFVYHLATFKLFPANPFQFHFLRLAIERIGFVWRWLAEWLTRMIG
jgi:energy-converting hydrogenase Eha subunit C